MSSSARARLGGRAQGSRWRPCRLPTPRRWARTWPAASWSRRSCHADPVMAELHRVSVDRRAGKGRRVAAAGMSQDRRFRNSSRALEAGDLALSTSGLKPRGRRAGNAVNTIHCTGFDRGRAEKTSPRRDQWGYRARRGELQGRPRHRPGNLDGLRHHGAGAKTA